MSRLAAWLHVGGMGACVSGGLVGEQVVTLYEVKSKLCMGMEPFTCRKTKVVGVISRTEKGKDAVA